MLCFVVLTNILLLTSLIAILSNSLTKVRGLSASGHESFREYGSMAVLGGTLLQVRSILGVYNVDYRKVMDHAREEYLFQ